MKYSTYIFCILLPLVLNKSAACKVSATQVSAAEPGVQGAAQSISNGSIKRVKPASRDSLRDHLSSRLSGYGISRGILPILTEKAAQQWTAGHHPRQVGNTDTSVSEERRLLIDLLKQCEDAHRDEADHTLTL